MILKSIPNLYCEKCKKHTLNRIGVFEGKKKKETIIGFMGKKCLNPGCWNRKKAKEIEYIFNKLI